MLSIDALHPQEVREALRLLSGDQPPVHRGLALRQLRTLLTAPSVVRSALDHAPDGAQAAFIRLAQDGPAPVDVLLGRGWWGRGTLPPPLDWLQRRGLVMAGEDGLVHATVEAREGFAKLACDVPATLDAGPTPSVADPLRVEKARSVVVAPTSAALDRALAVPAADLRAIAPTVAISSQGSAAVATALRAAGLVLAQDTVVAAQPSEPALPTVTEEAVGPRPVRALLERALAEGRQVRLEYFASSRGGAATDRVVDPWTFRDDLLHGYCHLRSSERTFAVDRIGRARLLPTSIEHPAP
jgi:WYL domain